MFEAVFVPNVQTFCSKKIRLLQLHTALTVKANFKLNNRVFDSSKSSSIKPTEPVVLCCLPCQWKRVRTESTEMVLIDNFGFWAGGGVSALTRSRSMVHT